MGQVYQFGAFRVDPVRRVLLREGEPVPITPKAFSILLLLIESRNRTVLKEELIQGAWSGAHVSDANLMQNISSLRKALGERAGDGRYIITIPGQGYRFAGDLTEVDDEEVAVPPPAPSLPLPAVPVGEDPVSLPPVLPAPQPPVLPGSASRNRRVLFLVALGAVLLLLGASALVWRQRSQERITGAEPGSATAAGRPDIAVLGLRNLSGDPTADGLGSTLAEMLATELAAGDQVRVIPGEDVERARRSLGDLPLKSLGSLDAASLQKLHGLLGAELIVEGAYLALPGGRAGEGAASPRARVRLDLRVLSAPGGEVVASVAEVGEERDLAGLVTRAGTRLRSLLGLAELT